MIEYPSSSLIVPQQARERREGLYMNSSWPSDDDLIRGMDINHDDIVDFLMECCWPGDLDRDYVLCAALRTTIGYMVSCQVLAKRFSTETDERLVSTAKVVRRSEQVSHETWMAL